MSLIRFLLLSMLSLSAGCGFKKLAIENADTIITYQVAKRLPLRADQKKELKQEIVRLLEKKKPLAREIIQLVSTVDLKNEKLVDSYYQKIEEHYLNLAREFSQLLSAQLSRLNERQQNELFENLEDENRDMLKKDPKEQLQEAHQRFHILFGTITESQIEIFRRHADYMVARKRARVERRQGLVRRWREIYAGKVEEGRKVGLFQESFTQYQADSLAGNKNLVLIKEIAPTLTNSQRKHFNRMIEELKDLLEYYTKINYK